MTEEFVSYWDIDTPLIEDSLEYHQLQADHFKQAARHVYGEEPYIFQAEVNGEPIDSMDEFRDLDSGLVKDMRLEHLTDKGAASLDYSADDNGKIFPPNPDYILKVDGSVSDRDVFETMFGRNLRRKGFGIVRDLLE